jgi:hypothetical protein
LNLLVDHSEKALFFKRNVYIFLVQRSYGPLLFQTHNAARTLLYLFVLEEKKADISMVGIVVAVPARKGKELAGDISFFHCFRERERSTHYKSKNAYHFLSNRNTLPIKSLSHNDTVSRQSQVQCGMLHSKGTPMCSCSWPFSYSHLAS